MDKKYIPLIVIAVGGLILSNKKSTATALQRTPPFLSPTDYIKFFYPIAQQESAGGTIPALFSLGQGGLESGWGTSDLATDANNHFGIKADRSWKGPTYNGFRSYNSAIDSYKDHSKFLKANTRYRSAFAYSDPIEFAKAVADAGYDEHPDTYLQAITDTIKTVKRYL